MAERRRGQALEDALLDAAWGELVDKGYADLTMDAVAQRAGTSRPVLYRRWSDRRSLVEAALAHVANCRPITMPDTGSLRGDVLDLMRQVNATRVDLVAMMSMHLAGYYQETGTSPADLRGTIAAGRRSVSAEIFERAAKRGEIDPARVTDRLKALPFDLLRLEILMTLRAAPDGLLEEIVDTLFLPLVTPRAR